MNIENIVEGMITKNYKQLCELLNEDIKTGKSKQLQLKDWERYFKFHKEGQKIIIDTIHNDIKEKVDMRKSENISENDKRHNGNNNFYGEDIQKLILLLMASSTIDNEIILPISILLNKLSMTNCNYSLGRRNQDKLSEVLNIDEKYINEFYDSTHSSLRSSLETSLNALDKKSLLRWQTVRMVCKKVAVVKYNELDEIEIDMDTDKVQYSIQEEYNLATKEQDLIILEAEKEILDLLGYETINEIIKHGLIDEFYKQVYKIVQKKANIKYYFNGYKLIFNRKDVISALEKYGEDLEPVRIELNNKVKEKTLDNAIKRQEKVEKETHCDFGEKHKTPKQKMRISDDYLNNIQLIINTVIDLKARNIRNKLKE
jgi:hypothetical protein